MAKKILVSVDPFEARAALLDGDRLVNVEVESAAASKRKGNVYKGRVTSVEPSLEAAFVDYGVSKDGFLPFDEVSYRSLASLTGHGRGTNRAGVRQGDWVLVQVAKEEFGKKGATLTMHVSLPGRFVVLMPFSERTGISRRLGTEERSRLRGLVSQLRIPEGFGVIVRTVGEAEQLADIQADLDQQVAVWEEIQRRFKSEPGAHEIHADAGLAVRFVRDYMTADVTEVLVEDEPSYRELVQYIESRMPQRRHLVRRYDGDLPLFVRHGVERQIDALLNDRVPLPSGGSIVIGQTEALVAIDVNSGRLKHRDVEDTAFRTNIEAAREVARQVVLRDLGGIIVVDFIDMEDLGRRRAVEDELKKALEGDKARLSFGKITDFGLLAFSRQRLRQSVESGAMLPCPTCSGTGRIRSPALLAMSALRKVRERLATQPATQRIAYVEVVAPVEVANFLNNRKRSALVQLEERFDTLIDVTGDASASPTEVRVTALNEVPADRTALRYYDEETPAAAVVPEEERAGQRAEPRPAKAAAEEGAPRRQGLLGGLLRRVFGFSEEEVEEVEVPAARAAEPMASAPALAYGRVASPEPSSGRAAGPVTSPAEPGAPEARPPRSEVAVAAPPRQESPPAPAASQPRPKRPPRPPRARASVAEPPATPAEEPPPLPPAPAVASEGKEATPGKRRRHRGGRGRRRGQGGEVQAQGRGQEASSGQAVAKAPAAAQTATSTEGRGPAEAVAVSPPEEAAGGGSQVAGMAGTENGPAVAPPKRRRRRGGRGRRGGAGGAQGTGGDAGGDGTGSRSDAEVT